MAVSMLPPAIAAWILWCAPLDGLTAGRAALAGRDFTVFWAAGHLSRGSALLALYDPAQLTSFLRDTFGPAIPAQIWPYPPTALLLAVPVAALSFELALPLYTAAGLLLLWLALRAGGLRRTVCACVLLSPAVAENALAGQNGALTASALAGGLLLLGRRPRLAGALLGALVLKPQLAVMVPVCLVAGRHWRALAAAAGTALILLLLSLLAFGADAWRDFLLAQPAVTAYFEAPWAASSAQRLFASVFMAGRAVGLTLSQAYEAQAAASLACAALVWQGWRQPGAASHLRIALALVATALASPWIHGYDMAILAIAITILLPSAKTYQLPLLAAGWVWPGAMSVLEVPPLLPALMTTLLLWVAFQLSLAIDGPAGRKLLRWA